MRIDSKGNVVAVNSGSYEKNGFLFLYCCHVTEQIIDKNNEAK